MCRVFPQFLYYRKVFFLVIPCCFWTHKNTQVFMLPRKVMVIHESSTVSANMKVCYIWIFRNHFWKILTSCSSPSTFADPEEGIKFLKMIEVQSRQPLKESLIFLALTTVTKMLSILAFIFVPCSHEMGCHLSKKYLFLKPSQKPILKYFWTAKIHLLQKGLMFK